MGTAPRISIVDMATQAQNASIGSALFEILMRLTAGPRRNRVKKADRGQDHANTDPAQTPTRFSPEKMTKTMNRDCAALSLTCSKD